MVQFSFLRYSGSSDFAYRVNGYLWYLWYPWFLFTYAYYTAKKSIETKSKEFVHLLFSLL